MNKNILWKAVIGILIAICFTLKADVTRSDNLKLKVEPKISPKAVPFSLFDVRLIDGSPFKSNQDRGVKYLLSLEPDRFLANFRKEAGLQPKAQHYGGWERMTISGHSLGHYLSACAIAYASTGDERFKERVNYIVNELEECQKAQGDGYVAAIPNGRKVFAEVEAGNIRSAGFDLNGCWVPIYTLHKEMAGLRDAYRLCGNAKALEVEKRLADWMYKIFIKLNDEQMQKVLACEHGGINEVLADLYADTGDERYLELSRKFHHKAILEPLARGIDILPGKHGNTQIPKLIGLATRYELTGNESDRAAAQFFWNRVVYHHSYVTGGNCDREYFGEPDKLNNRLSEDTTETCKVYNMLKLTRHIFGWDADPAVADFYERALLNHILATQHPDGRVIYNLSLKPGHYKVYQSMYDGFTCCVGTGMENHVKYGEFIYFHDDGGIWVNLYIPSRVEWKKKGVVLTQESKFPYSGNIKFTVNCKENQEFGIRFRHPHWAKGNMVVKVNGKEVKVNSKPISYAEVKRVWKDGDVVEVSLPMSLRIETMPDNPNRIAIFYGPTLLAANLGPVNDPKARDPFYVPVLITEGKPVQDWVKPVEVEKLLFKTDGVGKPRDVDLEPFFSLHDRRYTVYLDIFTTEEWKKKENEMKAEIERQKKLEARTVDILHVGEMQPERDHNMAGEKTATGEAHGRKWRHATDGGWFAFDMKVSKDEPVELVCTYWGSDAGNRVFDILVDGEKIATQRLENNKPNQFFDVVYPIPEKLTKGKEKVNIRFQAHPGAWAGGVFGVRILKVEKTSTNTSSGTNTGESASVQTPIQKALIKIDPDSKGEPISKYIYGQFIEHLGRCIYGGIWAEMLEDRKFYYPITGNYSPYRGFRDNPYPILRSSPWQIIGDANNVTMSTNKPFVGRHTPFIKGETAIRHNNLGVDKGKGYVGYLWAKSDDKAAIEVTLGWGDNPSDKQTVSLGKLTKQYKKYPFRFTAGDTTDNAFFEIKVKNGSAFIGTVSLMPANNVNGFRADTLALLKELNAPIYRWPGGNFVSGYDWRDGIGDRDRRPPRRNPAWTGVEHNDVGIHEFVQFCRLLKAEPLVTVNTGFGDAYSAAAFLEYCNGSTKTYWGKKRADNGSPQPFNIKFWAIGNEMWGQWQLGYMALEHYVQKHNWVVEKMREVDPTIICIGSGNAGPWSEGLLKNCYNYMDLIAEHFYCQERQDLVAHTRLIPDNIRNKVNFHRKMREQYPVLKEKNIRIAMTEWNYWYGPHVFGELGTRYFLKDALGIAAGLHEYARQSDIIHSAFYAQTVNVIGCIKTSRRNAAFETTGLVLKLYRNQFEEIPLGTKSEGVIDAQAAVSKNGKRLTIGIVNPTMLPQEITLEIPNLKLKEQGLKWQIAGNDPKAYNDPDTAPDKVVIAERKVKGNKVLSVEPCSVTLFAFDIE